MRLTENKSDGCFQYVHKIVITVNVSGLNNSVKRQRLSDWIKREDANDEFTRAILNIDMVG